MSQYMLMFSLGPVQSFIAQARKTRDLWLGSFLLSTLMEAGMRDIPTKSLVFPADKEIKKKIPDLPNKFVAIFDTLDQAKDCIVQCETNIKECWRGICQNVWREIIEEPSRASTLASELTFVREIWDRQVNPDTFFEVFWAITRGSETEYSDWLERTQQALDARKRLRNFAAQLPGEQGEKSTISGEREALHGKGTSRKDVIDFWKDLTASADLSPRDISHDGDERLDAIDTIKRFATQSKSPLIPNNPFPSTSSIATATFVEGLLSGRVDSNIIEDWINTTEKLADASPESIPYLYNLSKRVTQGQRILKRDGDCYFPETFTPYRLEKDYNRSKGKETNTLAENGREKLRKLVTEAKSKDISRPSSYYAMIQMDGDKMGKLLSGVENLKEHKEISKVLSQFARESALKLVEQDYPGRLIYAGGDDVFALAPLARDPINVRPGETGTVLDLVNRLQQQYHEVVANAVREEGRKKLVTASTGIAIAHHFTALSYVRRMSKEAEDAAKKRYGRNALVVTILRRSGEQTKVGCHWHYDGLDDKPVELFTSFYKLFNDNDLSPKCIYILLEEAPTLVKLDEAAQQSEIRRVLKRQRDKKGEPSDKQIDALAERIVKLAQAMDKVPLSNDQEKQLAVELHSDTRRYGLVEVLGWLLVMEFLTRKGEE
ncbi:MAG TPA: type III-B CRISPR-associated protein Cas10/Cmr2 [Ktedonobacteraceae bacterium]|nr:type III-B CRISPR-associated protein Cas10/Cmr2 [Ktedonobacteraceae bacterium]